MVHCHSVISASSRRRRRNPSPSRSFNGEGFIPALGAPHSSRQWEPVKAGTSSGRSSGSSSSSLLGFGWLPSAPPGTSSSASSRPASLVSSRSRTSSLGVSTSPGRAQTTWSSDETTKASSSKASSKK